VATILVVAVAFLVKGRNLVLAQAAFWTGARSTSEGATNAAQALSFA
jgi:hypothetical protein